MDPTNHQDEALNTIKKLSDAIERRRAAEAEVGKAQRDLAMVHVKNAGTSDALNAALRDFSGTAMHW